MLTRFLHFLLVSLAAATAFADSSRDAIDFSGFLKDAQAAELHRAQRRVDLDTFHQLAAQPGTVVLDTRSRAAYEMRHLRGARHLNLSDMTEESLRRVLGSRDTRVLIYCNNNFLDDPVAFPTKMPAAALNLATYVTLYTYGYRDVWELADILDVDDPRLAFEGGEGAAQLREPASSISPTVR